ncbi:MAG: dihydrodipicolinate reductase C-terminal domain-containing protein, partial [Halolamina sp.]
DLTERQHGREGEQPRQTDEIGVHARRAGDVTGEHEVLLAGNRETLSLSHSAGDRGVFAEGALDAAVALAGREPGRYEFADLR